MKLYKDTINIGTKKKIMKELRGVKGWAIKPYAKQRIKERNISIDKLFEVCREGELIEYHNEKGTRRVLLRDGQGTCVVADLDTKNIVTVFTNDPENQHDHLHRDKYLFSGG